MADPSPYRPNALLIPAKTHPDVVVKSVAARDQEKALNYACKHGIQDVKGSYQGELSLQCPRKCVRGLNAQARYCLCIA